MKKHFLKLKGIALMYTVVTLMMIGLKEPRGSLIE
jgi:hypothetical protein